MKTHFNVSDQELTAATGGFVQSSPVIEEIGREISKGLKNFGEKFMKALKDYPVTTGPLY